jgi:hypothetical protein
LGGYWQAMNGECQYHVGPTAKDRKIKEIPTAKPMNQRPHLGHCIDSKMSSSNVTAPSKTTHP